MVVVVARRDVTLATDAKEGGQMGKIKVGIDVKSYTVLLANHKSYNSFLDNCLIRVIYFSVCSRFNDSGNTMSAYHEVLIASQQ